MSRYAIPIRIASARFSRFVRKFHRCPPLGADPQGYLAFILERISGRQFDVLLPIHEQGLLLAKVQARHRAVMSRSRCRASTAICAPTTRSASARSSPSSACRNRRPASCTSASELMAAKRFPMVLKTPVGTASRGTWIVKDEAELEKAVAEIEAVAWLRRRAARAGCRRRRVAAGAGGVREWRAGRVACLPPDRARRRRRLRDQGERAAIRSCAGILRASANIWSGTARCRSTTSSTSVRACRATSIAIRGWSSR